MRSMNLTVNAGGSKAGDLDRQAGLLKTWIARLADPIGSHENSAQTGQKPLDMNAPSA